MSGIIRHKLTLTAIDDIDLLTGYAAAHKTRVKDISVMRYKNGYGFTWFRWQNGAIGLFNANNCYDLYNYLRSMYRSVKVTDFTTKTAFPWYDLSRDKPAPEPEPEPVEAAPKAVIRKRVRK